MIKHRADSIQKLNDEQAAEAKKDKTIAEQADTSVCTKQSTISTGSR